MWKQTPPAPGFFDFAKSPPIKNTLKGLVIPEQVREIQSSLDRIQDNRGVLVLRDVVDLATIFIISSHKNAKRIKEIRLKSWKAIDLAKIKSEYSENIKAFKNLFHIDIPDFILQLHHYHECMSALSVVNDSSGWWLVEIDGFETLQNGIFGKVFTDNVPEEKDVLSFRYARDSLNYFPIFPRDYDYMTQGLIFDYMKNSFSPFIGYGGNEYFANKGIWDCISLAFDFCLRYQESYFDLEEFTHDELNELLAEEECRVGLLAWFYSLATTGYLNFHSMPSIKPSASQSLRYEGLTEAKRNKLSNGNMFFVAEEFAVQYSFYPRLPVKFSKNFNPGFTYELLESLLLVFRDTPVRQNLKRFLSQTKKSKSELLELMEMPKELQSATKTSQQTVDIFFTIVEKFCNAEIQAGRPYLAFLVGLYAWEREEEATSKLAARLLLNVPDEICHPIIKTVARLHSESRFYKSISV